MFQNNAYPVLSVNILTWNRRLDLLELLESLSKQHLTDYEVVIVDNGSTDGTREAVLAQYPHVRYIMLHKNLGLSAGRNIGAVNSRGAYLLFLDNDLMLTDPGILTKMICLADSHPNCIAVSGEIMNFPYTEQSETCAPDDLLAKISKAPERNYYDWFFRGGGSLFRRAEFLALGGLTDTYHYGGEEWDLAFRVHESDRRFLTSTGLRFFHKVSPMQRPNAFKALIFQNMVLAQLHYMPWSDALISCSLQFPSALVKAWRGKWLGEYCRAVGRILLRLPRLLFERTPVSRDVMRRWYYLRTHQVDDYRLVESSRMTILSYYYYRWRERRSFSELSSAMSESTPSQPCQ